MEYSIIGYIFYGIIMGISEFLPVSASGNAYIYGFLTGTDDFAPLLKLFVHLGALAALLLQCGKRLLYIQGQMHIASLPAKRRKRQPDLIAVADGRLLLSALFPMSVCLVMTVLFSHRLQNIILLIAMLTITGILVYIPQHFPGGNRSSRGMSGMDGLILGVLSGLRLIPGFSGFGLVISAGLLRGCDREYIVNTSLMLSGLSLVLLLILDVIALFAVGTAGITLFAVFVCVLAALAAFGCCFGSIVAVRYLAVRVGFSGFAFFSWGAAMFSFIFYLIT